MQSGQYSFSAEPRAVGVRSKYREEPRKSMNTNIMFDSRVVRGNTYAGSLAPGDSGKEERSSLPKKKRRPLRPRSPPSIFDIQPQLTQHVAVSLEEYLVEKKEKPQEVEVQTQTARFLIRPATPEYIPKKTGIDASTQIEDVDCLFDFDVEVEPILDVLVGKTLEQGQLEVEEEYELQALRSRKIELQSVNQEEQERMRRMEAAELQRWKEKEEHKKRQRARVEREQKLWEKVTSGRVVQRLFRELQPTVLDRLANQGFFPDPVREQISANFLPWVMGELATVVDAAGHARVLLDEALSRGVEVGQQRAAAAVAERAAAAEAARQLALYLVAPELLESEDPVGPFKLDGDATGAEALAKIQRWLRKKLGDEDVAAEYNLVYMEKQMDPEKNLREQGLVDGATLQLLRPVEDDASEED